MEQKSMTPQEAAEEAFKAEKERNINFWQKEEEIADEIAYWKDVFIRGYNKSTEVSESDLIARFEEIKKNPGNSLKDVVFLDGAIAVIQAYFKVNKKSPS